MRQMSYSLLFLFAIVCQLVCLAVSKEESEQEPVIICPDNSRCVITTEKWHQDKKFMKTVLDRIEKSNITLNYDYYFDDNGELKLTFPKKMVGRNLILPNARIPQVSTVRAYLLTSYNESLKHQSLCSNKSSTAFMLDDATDHQMGSACIWSLNSKGSNEYECAFAPLQGNNTTSKVTIIPALEIRKKLAAFRARIGCSSQEMAQLRSVMDLHFSHSNVGDTGIGLMTWIQICGSVVLASIAVLTLYFLRGWIAAKYHVISTKLF